MNRLKKTIFVMALLMSMSITLFAVLTEYTFSSTAGTYTPITGGTVFGDAAIDDERYVDPATPAGGTVSTGVGIPIGFNFTYNEISFDRFAINANGWISFGQSALTPSVNIQSSSSYTPISATSTATPAYLSSRVVAFAADLKGADANAVVRVETLGTSPNQVTVIQWEGFRPYSSTFEGTTMNFQIKLYETSNNIEIVYGPSTIVTTSNSTPQVGLRGEVNTDYTARTTTDNWAATTLGATNAANLVYNATVYPADGLTFAFNAPVSGVAPNPATLISPANAATGVAINTNLTWASGGGMPTGYILNFGTDNPPTNLVSNFDLGNVLFYNPATDLLYNTTYYFQVVPYNEHGNASACPVWSFTTMPDPTINTFPYVQSFEGDVFPPAGWTNIKLAGTGTPGIWDVQTAGTYPTCTPADGAKMIRYNCFSLSAGTIGELATPPVAFPAPGYRVKFSMYHDPGYPPTAPALGDYIEVFYGASTTPLLTLQRYAETAEWLVHEVTLPIAAGGETSNLRFVANSAYGNNIFLDNIIIEALPSNAVFAVNPTEKNFGQVMINTSSPAQVFTISNAGTGNLGIVSIALAGTNADQFTLTNTNTLPLDIISGNNITVSVVFNPTTAGAKTAELVITDNLTRTAHTVALSGEGFDASITVPHTQNFDVNVTLPNLPTGWANYTSETGTDARPWRTANSTTINPVSAPNFVACYYHSTNPKNAWMVTPPVAMVAGNAYRIKFMVKAPGWQGTPEKMKLTVATDQALTAISAGTILWNDDNMLISAYEEKVVSFVPATSGNYYFGWHAYSDADIDYIAVDDIIFEIGAVMMPPTALQATVGNAVVNLSWTAPAAGSTATFAGYKVYRDGTAITTTPLTATTYVDNTVTNGTTYQYYVTALYTSPDGESDPSNTVSATPVAPGLYPPVGLNAMVIGDDVTLNWQAAGPVSTWITHADDVYDDAIGTNSAATFSVAQRFTNAQLTNLGVVGSQITKVRFMAHEPAATYTVKVWTGGTSSPYAAGTVAATQAVPSINVDDWTEVILTTPVTIPATGEVWFGYDINTPSGYPAGADAGPALNGFGNMMYWQNAWTTLTALAATLDYNWIIQAYATEGTGRAAKYITAAPVAPVRVKEEMQLTPEMPSLFQAIPVTRNAVRTSDRDLLGYKVYRGTTLLTPTALPTTTLTYTDENLANGEYTYNVTALYTEGESAPATVTATVNVGGGTITTFPWNEGFEGATFPPANWANIDNDGDTNMWFSYAVAGAPHGGTKCAGSASWAGGVALTPDNWLITPKIELPTYAANQTAYLRFWVAAQDPDWPQEHYSVMISTTNTNIASFTSVLSETLQSGDWVQKSIALNNYSNQDIYIAFRHHAVTDMFYIKLDDVLVELGQDASTPVAKQTKLGKNYPNPFNPSTSIAYSLKERTQVSVEVFNIKGQKVRTLVNDVMNAGDHSIVWNGKDDHNNDAGSGVYFYRMTTPNYSSTGKMILVK